MILEHLDKLINERMEKAWIGVDLDGTLAVHNSGYDVNEIGEPIPEMVRRVKRWLESGKNVKIFTARVADEKTKDQAEKVIKAWCKEHLGKELPVTNMKDRYMVRLWDDRAIRVYKNRGLIR